MSVARAQPPTTAYDASSESSLAGFAAFRLAVQRNAAIAAASNVARLPMRRPTLAFLRAGARWSAWGSMPGTGAPILQAADLGEAEAHQVAADFAELGVVSLWGDA
jgi:hypothetical protein